MISHSAEETRRLGESLARELRAGDVILLEGPLGAGKSEMARGIARGLGVAETVASPSFTILNAYTSGRTPLYHFDWYRLESEEELYELGMEEYLGGDGIALVEWPGRCPDALPGEFLMIELTPRGETERELRIHRHGAFRRLETFSEPEKAEGLSPETAEESSPVTETGTKAEPDTAESLSPDTAPASSPEAGKEARDA